MKSLEVAVVSIIVFIAVLLCSNRYEEYSCHYEYSDLKSYDNYLTDCIKEISSKIESSEESPFYCISYNFIDILSLRGTKQSSQFYSDKTKKFEFIKIKKEFKYKPICNKSNSDSKEMMKNAPSFLSHLHFATTDPNADRGCKNKILML